MTPEEESKANEWFVKSIPEVMRLTKQPEWETLQEYVKAEIGIKSKMLENSSNWESTRYVQGMMVGLRFVERLPEVLDAKYREIMDSDKDSEQEVNDG